jgi:hypothetical protein
MQEQQLVWSQEECRVSRHSLFILLYSSQLTWYLLVVVRMLPIPQHGKFKDSPSFITICTPQGLVVKVTCMRHGWMPGLKNFLSLHRPRATLFTLNVCAPPESLGVIAWLLHCSSLAACAKDMVFQGLT